MQEIAAVTRRKRTHGSPSQAPYMAMAILSSHKSKVPSGSALQFGSAVGKERPPSLVRHVHVSRPYLGETRTEPIFCGLISKGCKPNRGRPTRPTSKRYEVDCSNMQSQQSPREKMLEEKPPSCRGRLNMPYLVYQVGVAQNYTAGVTQVFVYLSIYQGSILDSPPFLSHTATPKYVHIHTLDTRTCIHLVVLKLPTKPKIPTYCSNTKMCNSKWLGSDSTIVARSQTTCASPSNRPNSQCSNEPNKKSL